MSTKTQEHQNNNGKNKQILVQQSQLNELIEWFRKAKCWNYDIRYDTYKKCVFFFLGTVDIEFKDRPNVQDVYGCIYTTIGDYVRSANASVDHWKDVIKELGGCK